MIIQISQTEIHQALTDFLANRASFSPSQILSINLDGSAGTTVANIEATLFPNKPADKAESAVDPKSAVVPDHPIFE